MAGTPQNDMNQILYVGADGHLWELFWPGVAPVAGWDITAASGAPARSGALAAYHHAATNTKHAVYRSADGRLHSLSWPATGGAVAHLELTAFAGAPLAADAPAAFTVPVGRITSCSEARTITSTRFGVEMARRAAPRRR